MLLQSVGSFLIKILPLIEENLSSVSSFILMLLISSSPFPHGYSLCRFHSWQLFLPAAATAARDGSPLDSVGQAKASHWWSPGY